MSQQDLLAKTRVANDELIALVESLDEATMSLKAFGDWSTKQLLTNISGWQRLNAEMMERIARGEHPIPEGADYGDDDRMSAGFAAEVAGKTTTEAIQFAHDAFNRFTRAIEALPPERFEQGRFAAQLVQGNGIDHVREHIAEIHDYIKGR